MSIFDVLSNGSLGSALDVLTSQAKSAASNLQRQTPGGVGGLLGAGALGALLGNVMNSDVVKNVALAGAGAVAWNFYRKWAAGKQAQQQPERQTQLDDGPIGSGANQFGMAASKAATSPFGAAAAAPTNVDPTAELVIRAMDYAARSDGNIDATEKQRMDTILQGMLPGENLDAVVEQISREPIDPAKIAAQVKSKEQGEDVYRLSCSVIDIDQFMELNYLSALANALGLSADRKKEIEQEAEQARQQLKAALPA